MKNASKLYKTTKRCRSCYSENISTVFSLGNTVVANFIDDCGKDKTISAPLELTLCKECSLLQLKHELPQDILFRNHYWYKSGINKTMESELAAIAHEAEKISRIKSGDSVLDIGCNDGTLLRSFKTPKLKLFGIEPAKNLISEAKIGTFKIINDYFNAEAFGTNKFKIITAIAMFYDVSDPNIFLNDVKTLLDDDGIFIIQQNYLPSMLKNLAFDNIVHEHLEYYSLFSLEKLLERHRLEIFDVVLSKINGGSIRTFIKHKDSKMRISNRVLKLRYKEKKDKLNLSSTYKKFKSDLFQNLYKLGKFLIKEKAKGKKIYIYGASTRGNTMLQYLKLDFNIIDGASERNPKKWNKRIAGTNIPIFSENAVRKIRPDYLLILPWYFREEILKRENEFLKRGGKMIFPLPEFEVYCLKKAC